jgi:hypothetical protein
MWRGAHASTTGVRVSIGEGRDGFGLHRVEHLVEIGEELIGGEMVRLWRILPAARHRDPKPRR